MGVAAEGRGETRRGPTLPRIAPAAEQSPQLISPPRHFHAELTGHASAYQHRTRELSVAGCLLREVVLANDAIIAAFLLARLQRDDAFSRPLVHVVLDSAEHVLHVRKVLTLVSAPVLRPVLRNGGTFQRTPRGSPCEGVGGYGQEVVLLPCEAGVPLLLECRGQLLLDLSIDFFLRETTPDSDGTDRT